MKANPGTETRDRWASLDGLGFGALQVEDIHDRSRFERHNRTLSKRPRPWSLATYVGVATAAGLAGCAFSASGLARRASRCAFNAVAAF